MSDFEKFKSLASTHMKKEGSKAFKIAKFTPIWSKMPNLAYKCEIPSATSICYSGNGLAYFWEFFHDNFEYKTQKDYKIRMINL